MVWSRLDSIPRRVASDQIIVTIINYNESTGPVQCPFHDVAGSLLVACKSTAVPLGRQHARNKREKNRSGLLTISI